ncbi:hypothetical protein [Mycobacterium kubicae]|uniref:Uncharacterized protein n=1 Tax=Mycobacterium kubicae TaxID=120959 RepID=A0AAX1J775_9MYCO|nr:hypothetical protein [Mycobacterium kubicae]MCV7095129.1 hypothetical protein [Mycobacterium kubicae]QNI12779.1 hypothetical protein GAN18_17650 [Mycobacterium kubicae]QPI36293.1 hypothetical protein I2456_17375 [Mycobacterium kubicae]
MTGNSETPCYGVCEGETLLSVIAGLLLVSLVVPALPVVCEYPPVPFIPVVCVALVASVLNTSLVKDRAQCIQLSCVIRLLVTRAHGVERPSAADSPKSGSCLHAVA